MPTIQHNVLAGADLHEPKGANTAPLGRTYVSNGTGSGTWLRSATSGWEIIGDNQAAQTLTKDAYTVIKNNALGGTTQGDYRLPGRATAWVPGSDQFDWNAGGFELGDVVELYFTMEVETTANTSSLFGQLQVASGTSSAYTIPLASQRIKGTATHNTAFSATLYMKDSVTLLNPTKLAILSDETGDKVNVSEFYIRTIPIYPVYA